MPTAAVAGDHPAGGGRKVLQHLEPGAKARLVEHVPVNFVFLGYERGQVDVNRFRAGLPTTSRPLVLMRRWYGLEDYVGITYTYDYDLTFADQAYEDAFFHFLRERGAEATITDFQHRYNEQVNNRLTIDDNVEIPGPAVERWLAQHPPGDVNVTENTVFFINWFGRDDFEFHIYTKTGEPDPDTGTDMGRGERDPLTGEPDGGDWSKYIAWGGTPRDDEETPLGKLARIWFHDLSAGPEDSSRNWDVDSPDPKHGRIPPIWEYHPNGFRRPSDLSTDLGRIARFVAIDTLFTPSPVYDPSLTPPRLPTSIDLDLNVYEARPGVDASDGLLDEVLVRNEVAELLPLHRITVDEQDPALDRDWTHCYTTWNVPWYTGEPRCRPDLDYPSWANLFVLNALKLDELRDDDTTDYELIAAAYSTPALAPLGMGGYADDNYRDGTQSFVHVFSHAILTEYGYGMTGLMIHELGHHFGLGHTFDGYDYETKTEFRATYPEYRFVGAGSGTNSPMGGYVNYDFSQFDRDNMNRWITAAYLEQANAILHEITLDDRARTVWKELERADAAAGRSRGFFEQHRYLAAATQARGAYMSILAAAKELGIEVVASAAGVTLDRGAVANRARSEPFPLIDPVPVHNERARERLRRDELGPP